MRTAEGDAELELPGLTRPRQQTVTLRWETYAALRNIRLDLSYETYDRILQEMIRKVYPAFANDF